MCRRIARSWGISKGLSIVAVGICRSIQYFRDGSTCNARVSNRLISKGLCLLKEAVGCREGGRVSAFNNTPLVYVGVLLGVVVYVRVYRLSFRPLQLPQLKHS